MERAILILVILGFLGLFGTDMIVSIWQLTASFF
jgi:hypothetical protein